MEVEPLLAAPDTRRENLALTVATLQDTEQCRRQIQVIEAIFRERTADFTKAAFVPDADETLSRYSPRGTCRLGQIVRQTRTRLRK